MDHNDLKTIQITVAGRIFPLKVNFADEQIVLDMEQELNDAIQNYQNQYASRDKLDCVLMTLLKVVFDQKKKDLLEIDKTQQIIQKVSNLSSLLQ